VLTLESILRPFSRVSTRFMDRTIKYLANNEALYSCIRCLERRRIQSIDCLSRILIIPDINIGDAVLGQVSVSVLKQLFPEVEISYAYQKQAHPLTIGNPNIDHHFPVITGRGYPTRRDLRRLRDLTKSIDFDLILIFSPYFPVKNLRDTNTIVIPPIRFIAEIIRAYTSDNRVAHLVHQLGKYTSEIGLAVNGGEPKEVQESVLLPHIYAPSHLCDKGRLLEKKLGLSKNEIRVMFNPDTSSRFTKPPFKLQVELLKGILDLDPVDRLLMNCGFTFQGIEEELLAQLPQSLKQKLTIIPPKIEIDEYTVLTDSVDVFITGDTGPMHLAAARKRSVDSHCPFRNSTALIGLFGATSAKIYGYDSARPGYMPSAQDAPARVFTGSPECKDLTCIDKVYKRCPQVLCFEGLKAEPVVNYVGNYLSSSA
jgi:ADP-heptose:LPS heptosyltransferase